MKTLILKKDTIKYIEENYGWKPARIALLEEERTEYIGMEIWEAYIFSEEVREDDENMSKHTLRHFPLARKDFTYKHIGADGCPSYILAAKAFNRKLKTDIWSLETFKAAAEEFAAKYEGCFVTVRGFDATFYGSDAKKTKTVSL